MIKVNADLDENEELLREHDIKSIPTILLMDSTGKVWDTSVGAKTEEWYRSWVQSNLAVAEELERANNVSCPEL